MPTKRLFSPVNLSAGAQIRLDGERAHYVGRVLRLSAGSELVLFDGTGGEHVATVVRISAGVVHLKIGKHEIQEIESPLAIHLVQAISRGDRMDHVVQKATELGVARISPVLTERCVVRLDGARASRRLAHWIRIAESACEQCGRNTVPGIDPPSRLASWFERHTGNGCRLMLAPGAPGTIASVAAPAAELTLLVGPEGGLSDAELEQALQQGFEAISLGPRVLRTETAALAALAVAQSHFGDL